MRDFHSYRAYQYAVDFAVGAVEIAGSLPAYERFGLADQLRRSAVSVPSNVAEGAGRPSEADFARFLYIAIGSLNEAETQVEIARRLGYLDQGQASALTSQAEETRKLITGLAKSVTSH